MKTDLLSPISFFFPNRLFSYDLLCIIKESILGPFSKFRCLIFIVGTLDSAVTNNPQASCRSNQWCLLLFKTENTKCIESFQFSKQIQVHKIYLQISSPILSSSGSSTKNLCPILFPLHFSVSCVAIHVPLFSGLHLNTCIRLWNVKLCPYHISVIMLRFS